MSIQFKRSSSPGAVPDTAHLAQGELGLNITDKKIYTKDTNNDIVNIGFSLEEADDKFLRKSGGVISGRLQLSAGARPAGPDDLVTQSYIEQIAGSYATVAESDAAYLARSGGAVTGAIELASGPTADNHAVPRSYVTSNFISNNQSGVVNGTLSVNTPTNDGHATTKKYVDDNFIGKNSSDSINGTLAVSTPTNNSHAATKKYVDDEIESNKSESYVVESGNNANGYYRRWSDGYREQWGLCVAGGYPNAETNTFPIPFTNAGSISITGNHNGGLPIGTNIIFGSVNTTTYLCETDYTGATSISSFWRATGY